MKHIIRRIIFVPMNLIYRISPKTAFKLIYFMKFKKSLNLKNPKSYNEKLNWLKLNYRDDLMPVCTDKYTVRKYVKDCGYGHFLSELLWEGFDPYEIPFDELPEQFVIKVTHGSGNNIICKNKNNLDIKKTQKKLKKWLKTKYIPCYGEWFYGVIKPRII